MKIDLLKNATCLTGLMLLSISANASVTQGTQQASVSLGASNPLSRHDFDGDRSEFGSTGPNLGLGYLYQLAPNLGVGADLSFKRLGDRDFRNGRGAGEIESSAWTLLAIGRGELMPESDIRPYGLLGFGLGGVKREIRYGNVSGFDRDQSSAGLAFALAGGVDFDISANVVAGAELRWNYINTSYNEIGTSSVRTLDLNFKVGYKF